MKNFKRIAGILFVCLLAVAVLAACGDKTDNGGNNNDNKGGTIGEQHTHKGSGEWLADKDNHWKLCADDDEKTDLGEHVMDNTTCSVCGVVIEEAEGAVTVSFLNDKSMVVRSLKYDAEGNVTEELTDYVYDADGNVTTMKITAGDKVVYEAEYAVDEEGYNYEKAATTYNADGTKKYFEYSNIGDILREAEYGADGSVKYDYTTVHTYGDNAKKISEKTYSGEKLIKETNYIVLFEDSWGGGSYKVEVITYNEDGTKTVEYFTENGDPYVE